MFSCFLVFPLSFSQVLCVIIVYMKKVLSFLFAVFLMAGVVSTSSLISESAYADDGCGGSFLGLKSWWCGLEMNGNTVKQPENEDQLKSYVLTIVSNIVDDLLAVVGIIAFGFLIYGGYLYITCEGEPSKATKAKSTITGAVIGLIISILSTAIIGFLMDIFNAGDAKNQDASGVLNSVLAAAYAIAGMVGVAFIIYGGVTLSTSAGDASKVKKGKNAILYSVIGLVVILLAAAITSFVVSNV